MTRELALALGGLTLAVAWIGPLPAQAANAFAAHMTIHVAVVAIAAPLLAIGLAGGRFDPVRRAPALFAPIAASLGDLVVVWGWHMPALHELARSRGDIFAVEQACFLAAGLWLWFSALGGARPPARSRAWAGVGALLFTSMHMTLLGALFALAPRALYAVHASSGGLADQHLGGALMLLVGGASYMAGGLWLTAAVLRDEAADARMRRASGDLVSDAPRRVLVERAGVRGEVHAGAAGPVVRKPGP